MNDAEKIDRALDGMAEAHAADAAGDAEEYREIARSFAGSAPGLAWRYRQAARLQAEVAAALRGERVQGAEREHHERSIRKTAGFCEAMAANCRDRAEPLGDSHPDLAKRYSEAAWREDEITTILVGEREFATEAELAELRKEADHA